MLDFDSVDPEQIISYLGFEYKLSNGNSGLQINIKTCPMCGNDDYKVYCNAETFLGNCFKCSKGFGPFSFIKAALGGSAASVYSFMEKQETGFRIKPKTQVINYKLNEDWVFPLNKRIETDDDLPPYLLDRKITAKIAKRFDLRTCESGFYKYKSPDGKVKIVDFSNRIIIPIYNIKGEIVTFQGRDYSGKSSKRYLFPNMLPGTGRYIYNADYIVRNKIKKVVLNEGVFDVYATTDALERDIKYKDWGVCGTFGKNLSIPLNTYGNSDQLTDLEALRKAGVEEFVIMWDGENAARLAAIEAGIKLASFGFNATVALNLPNDKDPGESTVSEIQNALDTRVSPDMFLLIKYRMTM